MLKHVCCQSCSASLVGARLRSLTFDHSRATTVLFRDTQLSQGNLTQRAKEQRGVHTTVTCKRDSGSRPTLDDVERISRGEGAKARGTGSRRIPHRLNAEERQQYDIAKQKGFLTVKGTGYRKERKGSPLANTFRQWCDAQAKPCVVIEQGYGANAMDVVMVDVSTLRGADAAEDQASFVSSASSLGYAVSEQNHRIPFTIEAWQEFGITNTKDSESEGAGAGSYGGSQQMAPEANNGYHGKGEASGVATESGNDMSDDKQTGTSSSTERSAEASDMGATSHTATETATMPSPYQQKKRLASSSPLAPIWTVQAQPVFFEAERPQAKELAKAFVALEE